jgi:hypothetical protein
MFLSCMPKSQACEKPDSFFCATLKVRAPLRTEPAPAHSLATHLCYFLASRLS